MKRRGFLLYGLASVASIALLATGISPKNQEIKLSKGNIVKYNKKNSLNNIVVTYYKKTPSGKLVKKKTTFAKFIFETDPNNLTEKEKTLQKTMARLYELNQRDPNFPLYGKFPNRTKSLTINACSLDDEQENWCMAFYHAQNNSVEFNGVDGKDEDDLLLSLLHELKHAEHFSDFLVKLDEWAKKNDHKAWQQLQFLTEEEAHRLEDYVRELIRNPNAPPHEDFVADISDQLDFLFSSWYREKYDRYYPISSTDKGLTKIPDCFPILGISKDDRDCDRVRNRIFERLKVFPPYPVEVEKLKERLQNDTLTPKDIDLFSSFSPTDVRKTFSEVIERCDEEEFKRLLTLYDNSRNNTNLEKNFTELFHRKDGFAALLGSSSFGPSSEETIAQIWLTHKGKAAVDKKWIDTILKNPQKYNTDSLKKVLDKSCPVYSDNAPASRSQPTDNPNTKMRRDILRDF